MTENLPLLESSREVGFEARQVLRHSTSAAIGTLNREVGYAHTSFSSIAVTPLGEPVFLWSLLAEHRKNIEFNNQISVLCEVASHRSNPQAGARITLVGHVYQTSEDIYQEYYLKKHPSAKLYAGFNDFDFFRFELEKTHSVGGFGKALWVKKDDFLCDPVTTSIFQQNQQEIIEKILALEPNYPHLLIEKLSGKIPKEAEIVTVDPDGIDLRAVGKNYRYDFNEEIKEISQLMEHLDKLLKTIRKD